MVLWQQPRSSPHLALSLPLVLSGSAVWVLRPVAVSGLHLPFVCRMANLQETRTRKEKKGGAVVHSAHVILKYINRSVLNCRCYLSVMPSMRQNVFLSLVSLLCFQKVARKNLEKREGHKKQ